ncbi:hypothetical protein GLOTRDRAFT_140121 [Gloeophyllum trabeum ATCC 11539]|uniref:Stress-response A/B barrel domain-containing protein n=1 Tax=Gloeophyllum trabeum (strain ATCC 11539 / FP-39264 / Madison 617) TaxID=670483 RepID=S7RGA2_GLOTA|nr:uncharacterized protein GLOTRDRAFT_140121 [Gloeophyllum trabeum ATCC 11539]EPQ53260.1 hypothetical protein GLOTRDRAFT_140121 [Gloeophyllum trabeum ATCC 11539]
MSAPIVHIVSFKYKDPAVAPEAARKFAALKDECKLDNGKGAPYIASFAGGSNISPEGMTKGLHQTFVMTFPDIPTRDYYLDHDPAHQAFKDYIFPLVEDAFVFDFKDGSYALAS